MFETKMSTTCLTKRALTDYVSMVGEKIVEEAKILGAKLASKSVVHVNSTSYGGGVAEILHKLVPLMQNVGLTAFWKVIEGSPDFFKTTKKFHNALQGEKMKLTNEMKKTYLKNAEENAKLLELDPDFVVIHDLQPLAMIQHYPQRRGKWVWRCHIDLSQPNQHFLNFLSSFIGLYDACVFSMKDYVKKTLKMKEIAIIPPSIDPLSDKNKPLTHTQVQSVLERYDVDEERPIITQVARFDPWKDPLGVIDVYRQIRKKIPDLQLLLIGSMARDDPEGWIYYEKALRYVGEDYDVHFLTDLIGVHDLEVNAFQRASDVILAKSIREGFGLTVTEALWKEIPVIGGRVGGIPLQIEDGISGFLVSSVKEAVEKTLYLLKHPRKAREMGKKGKKHVFKNFLITRHLVDYLNLFNKLSR
ncbi:MAG: glycosyltransferase [Candidatus Bathyarchaeia archaeon]